MRKRVQSSSRAPVHAPVKGPILAYLATVADASTAQICAATKLDSVAVRNALATLSGPAAQVKRSGVSPRHRFAITARGRTAVERMPDAPPPRRLPVVSDSKRTYMNPVGKSTEVQREECARYDECAKVFVRIYGNAQARCGTPLARCRWHEPVAAIAGAASYARSGRSSQESAIYAGWT